MKLLVFLVLLEMVYFNIIIGYFDGNLRINKLLMEMKINFQAIKICS